MNRLHNPFVMLILFAAWLVLILCASLAMACSNQTDSPNAADSCFDPIEIIYPGTTTLTLEDRWTQYARMSAPMLGASSGATCDSCNSSNDSAIVSTENTHDTAYGYTVYFAFQFTTAEMKCVTGVSLWIHDSDLDGGQTCEIWSESSGKPGSIYSVGFTGTVANVSNTLTLNEILFSSTQTLPAGTYWAVCHSTNGTIFYGYQGSGCVTGFKYSSDNGDTWDDTNACFDWSVLGCS